MRTSIALRAMPVRDDRCSSPQCRPHRFSASVMLLLAAVLVIGMQPGISFAAGSGNCLDFDGTSDWAYDDGFPTSFPSITLEAWIYHRTLPAARQRYVWLERIHEIGGELACILHDGASSPGQLHFYISVGGVYRHVAVNAVLQAGKWYHVAGTWDASMLRLYLNGRLLTVAPATGSLDLGTSFVAVSDSDEPMDGYIDEVRIWRAARTTEEIRRAMFREPAGTETELKGYWKFNESSGTIAYDSAGDVDLGLHGGMTSDDWVPSGAFCGPRNALDFDGSNDYVNVGNDASLDVGNTMTIEAWVKPSNLSSRYGVFSTRLYNAAGSFQLEIGPGDGGTNRVAVSGLSTWVAQTGDNAIAAGQWTHIAYTRSGTGAGTHTIYVNGMAQTLVSDADYTFVNNTNNKVIASGTSGGQMLPGQIDEVRVWNVVRTAAQIREGMCTNLVRTESGLMGYWRCDQETGSTLDDWSLSGNHGTLMNMSDSDWVASDAFTTWIGCAGTSWATSHNWSRGIVPNSSATSVGILDAALASDPSVAGTYACNTLVIGTGTTLTIGSGHRVTVKGNAWGMGTVAGSGTVELTGAGANHAIAGTFGGVEVDEASGARQMGDLTTNGTLTLTNGALSIAANTLTVNGAISAGSGSLTGGSSSNITFGGSGASTNLPAVTLNNLAINRANGIGLGGSVTTGGTLTLTNGALSIAANTLTINGPISAGSGSLTGGSSSNITFGGSGASTNLPAIMLNNLAINRPNGINLSGNVTVNGTLTVTSGDLDLSGSTLTLGSAASMSETEGNTVKGSSGMITTTRTFNAGDLSGGVNIAGMGAQIATNAGLGVTTITRGHSVQTWVSLASVLRWFDITPANNSGLNATLVYHYDDSELNGLTESRLGLGRSTDSGATWSGEGGTVDAGNETITRGGIDALSRWSAFDCGFPTYTSLTGLYYCSVAWGDYDNDGDLDVLMAGETGSGYITRIYRNDGSNTFTDIGAGLPGVRLCSVAWGDYDNDGDLDVLMAGETGSGYITRIYRNEGSNTFTDIGAGLPGVRDCGVAWGDYDNDGDLDVLMAGSTGSDRITRIYRNDGSNTFTAIDAGLPSVSRCSVAWGDYDSDGDLDVLMAGYTGSSRITRIHRNEGSGVFTDIGAGLEGIDYCSVAWGDYDNDGDLDVLMAGYASSGITRIYRNDGSDTFTDIGAGLLGVQLCSVAWGDYDNDGDLDVLMAGWTGSSRITRIYRNDGSDAFTDISAGLPGVHESSVAWGDYDNDGDLDVLLAGNATSGYITRIYRNDGVRINTVPDVPSNLAASTADEGVTLTWNAAADLATPQAGLTYNLRIGASPGGVEAMSPMADVGNGWRRIPALGNANHDTTWAVRGLSDGRYYWSVQAIDHGFAGSAFAAEDSFDVCAGSLTLADSLSGGDLVLHWNVVPPATAYWVFGAVNEPFFVPQMESPFGYRVAVTADTTWSSSAGISNPDTNWTYQVIAVDASEQERGRSNRVGEYEFALP